jgi:ketosteroid isomerase-like protein
MTQPRSPQEVFLALVNAVAEGRIDEVPDLYAEQINVLYPFDPLRPPALRSRDEMRERCGLAVASGPQQPRRVGNLTIHQTIDPEVIIAEFEYQGTDPGTGEPTMQPVILVLRVRMGEIVSSRDYQDHFTMARARGQLDALVAAVNTQSAARANPTT